MLRRDFGLNSKCFRVHGCLLKLQLLSTELKSGDQLDQNLKEPLLLLPWVYVVGPAEGPIHPSRFSGVAEGRVVLTRI